MIFDCQICRSRGKMYKTSNKSDFITYVADDDNYDNQKRRRQSYLRSWKQLSRLQRNVFKVVVSLTILCVMYLLFLPGRKAAQSDTNFARDHNIGREPGNHGDAGKLPVLNINQDGVRQGQGGNMHQAEEPKRHKKGPPRIHRDPPKDNKSGQAEEPVLHIPDDAVARNGPSEARDQDDSKKHVAGGSDDESQSRKGDSESKSSIYGAKNERQEAVVGAFLHAWKAYRAHAWGHDELKPISKSYNNWFGLGLTIIDALDTMYIMGLNEEFEEARNWVENDMNIKPNIDVNLFETTIRVLGGLLGAFHLSRDEAFLDKAKVLGNSLLPAFNTKSKVPYADVNLKTGKAHAPRWGPDSSVSEVSTIQLEFRDLTFTTKDNRFKEAADTVMNHLHNLPKTDGLVPIFINANTGQFRQQSTITFGARADSYYEYLLKQWLQTGKSERRFKEDFDAAMTGTKNRLLRRSGPSNLLFVGELVNKNFSPKMDHLVCFLPGTLALGYFHGLDESYLELAHNLANTCYQMYAQMPTFLSPEIAHFNMLPGTKDDIIVKPADAHNLLRPETIESFFYLYRITKDESYRDWGWQIFQAFERYTKIPGGGYSSISNVKNPDKPSFRDKMESFFLGETLKYFFLLFSDEPDLLPLDRYVLNTEGHPLPIRTIDGAIMH